MLKKIGSLVRDHIRDNKFTYLTLFLFYITGICLGALSVNDLDYQQKDEVVTFFNGFIKLLDTSNFSQTALFKMSFIDNVKLILLFWLLGFTVIGFPMYYVIIGMRGFSTGFSSGIIMAVMGTKGIFISSICFVPKELILVPCLIALGVNGIKLSGGLFRTILKKQGTKEVEVKQRIFPYSFVAAFFSVFILISSLIEAFISAGALKILNI